MRRLLSLLAFVVFAGAFADATLAQNRAASLAVEALTAEAQARVVPIDSLLRFRTRAVAGGRIDVDEGVFRAVYRIGRRMAPAASPEAMGQSYLAAEAARFGWTETLDDLELKTVVQGRYSTHLTYQQTFYGLPVYNRLVKVNLNRAGQPTMVVSGYAPHLARVRSFNATPTLSAAAAQARVQSLVSRRGAQTTTPELVVYPSEVPRLAWRLLAWPEGIAAEWEVLIEARTGEILLLFDQSTHARAEQPRGKGEEAEQANRSDAETSGARAKAKTPVIHPKSNIQNPISKIVDGTGLVFDPDPLTTAGVDYGAPYVDADDADVPELNAQRIQVTLRDITLGADGLYRLEGPFVKIDGSTSIGGTGSESPAEADPTAFQYTRADDFFEAVMAYYHIDKSQRYVQSLDVGHDIRADTVLVNPHGLGNADNSKYFLGRNAIAFGDGGVDDGEDADVIWHEYGHALLEGSTPGLIRGLEGQAFHEGWSDYWAASYSRGLIEAGKVPNHDWAAIYSWDGHNTFWGGRTLNHQGRYPEDLVGQEHTDGLLWATTLMELYEAVNKDINDRLNLASHSYLSPPTTFADAAEALIQADLDLYGGEHLGVIIDRLGARGYIDPAAFGPLVAHEPIRHIEQEGSTVTIEVDATSLSAPVASVSFFYSVNGGSFDLIELDAQGNDRYTGSLTLPPEATEVAYYLEAADVSGLRTLLPAGAPQHTFTFGVGPDMEAPLITHEPFEQVPLQTWPATVAAEVDDNQGVDSVWVSFEVDRPDGTRVTEGAFGLQREQERYIGDFPVPVDALHENDKVRYRLHALDVARNANEALLPAAGLPAFEFTMVVEGVLASFDFETDQALEAIGVWIRGIPNFGVQVAHSGQHVWATGVDVAYPATVHRSQLDLPPFNLGDQPSYLIFWHWYDFEHSGEVEPGQATSGVLWDGGNVKASTTNGASWVVLEPMGGYTGTLETGTGNPLQGERAFGGYSYGWRRVVVALPQADNLRLRFDFGTDGSNTLQTVSYAGWYLDDVRIVTLRSQDVTPPTLVTAPPALMFADNGRLPPTLIAQVTDNVGVESVLAEYEVFAASGARQQGTLRLGMSPTDLTTFLGVISTGEPLTVGDLIDYRLRLRDFDGNTTLFPALGEAPLRIQYRLTESTSVLRNVRASGLWTPLGQGWTVIPTDGPLEPRSGLVLDPLDLPDNVEDIAFTLTHRYHFGSDLGGNLKLSLNDGASWTVLVPVGGYGATYEPEAGHPMAGEQVFAGQVVNDVVVAFDLTEFAGQQVRLRVDFGATRGLQADEFWRISEASLAFSTLDQAFDIPRELALHPNFPDPFSNNTTISYTVPETMSVRLEMYNILGQRIAVLVDQEKPAGTYTLTLGRGSLASGVYLLRMIANGTQHIERMVIAH